MSKKKVVQIRFEDENDFEKLKNHRAKKGFKTNASYFTSLYVNDLKDVFSDKTYYIAPQDDERVLSKSNVEIQRILNRLKDEKNS